MTRPDGQRNAHAAQRRCRDHRHQRGCQPVPLLACLLPCSRGCHRNPPALSSCAQCVAECPFRHRPDHGLLLHPREKCLRASRVDVHRVYLFLRLSRRLHHELRTAWRNEIPRRRRDPLGLFPSAYLTHRALGRGPADDSHHVFSLAQRTLSRAPAARALDVSDLALRLRHGRHRLRHAGGVSLSARA